MHVDAAKCQQQVWLLLLANQKHTFAQQEIKSYYWLIFIIKSLVRNSFYDTHYYVCHTYLC